MPFNMSERDLDLFILEELHASSGFADWFAGKLSLPEAQFERARHSVSTMAVERWGETDVLAFYAQASGTLAVLIEDKIAADFTDRQAERYHERGKKLIENGEASAYTTVLVAPNAYLSRVPADEAWDRRVAVEDLAAWFGEQPGAHARWRAEAFQRMLDNLRKNAGAGREDVRRFSAEFAAFLRSSYPGFQHREIDQSWGLELDFPGRPRNARLFWKPNQSVVDLEFYAPHVGKLDSHPEEAGLARRLASAGGLRSDRLRAPVGLAAWGEPLATQPEVLEEVMAAAQRLSRLAYVVVNYPKSS